MDDLTHENERIRELLYNAEQGIDVLRACLVRIAVGCVQRSMSSVDILVCIRDCSSAIIDEAEKEIAHG